MFESATRFIALELRRREAAREGDGESALGRYESERSRGREERGGGDRERSGLVAHAMLCAEAKDAPL